MPKGVVNKFAACVLPHGLGLLVLGEPPYIQLRTAAAIERRCDKTPRTCMLHALAAARTPKRKVMTMLRRMGK